MKHGFILLISLKIIARKGPITGYALAKEIGAISGREPSSGTIYPMLKNLQEKGFIRGEPRGKKIFYSISEKGKEFLRQKMALRDSFIGKMMELMSLLDESLAEDLKIGLKRPYTDGSFSEEKAGLAKIFELIRTIKCALGRGISAEAVISVLDEAIMKIEELKSERSERKKD